VQTGALAQVGKAGALVVDCPKPGAPKPDAKTRAALDNKLVCSVMCCCNQFPDVGADGQSLKQSCASAAFEAADKLTGYRSRYKPEVSYDMTADEPRPLMHRDANGADTTRRSEYWLGRAKSEIENFGGGRGQVRRPDLVVVKDPCLPPTPDNIERVVELKFGVDKRSPEQDHDYRRIADGPDNYQVFRAGGRQRQDDETVCTCDEGKRQPQQTPVTVPAPEPVPTWRKVGKVVGYGALTVVGVVATGVAILSPFDGPVGDVAAGAGTLAMASRTAAAWAALFAVPAAGVP